MGATAEAERAPEKDHGVSPLTRILDRVFGFDFFVSYAHADAPGYAERLVEQLHAQGFRPFLDKHVYVAGDELNASTLRRIKASSKLIVVVGEQALQSHWVLQEVETAIAANRPIIAIDLLGNLHARAAEIPLAGLLRERIHIREPDGAAAQTPSEHTMQSLERSFQATRREVLRLRLALAATLFFAVLAGFSYWQKKLADDRAAQYLDFCNRVVKMVMAGNQKIEDLRTSEFGNLIADVTVTLAQLPDPATDPDLRCIPAGSDGS